MGILTFIPENQVLPLALKLVRQSKKCLYLTMMMAEEVKFQPKVYTDLVLEKVKGGIVIKRVGFGTRDDYLKSLKILGFKKFSKNFCFKYLPLNKYSQRFLICDEKKMIFAVYLTPRKKLVFYTDDKSLIKEFLVYFKFIFKNAKIERR